MKMIPANILDRFEQIAALTLYAFLVYRIWPEDFAANHLAPALILLSEGVIVLFLLIRRPTDNISLRPQDWIAAVAGTVAPLLVNKVAEPNHLAIGVSIMLFGMITQISAKFSLRRSFGLVAANRGVRTGGAYRYVRHPMYLGYMISHAGFMIMSPTPWNFLVYAIGWTCLVLRVQFEERLLSQDPDYQAFMGRVRYRLVPGIY